MYSNLSLLLPFLKTQKRMWGRGELVNSCHEWKVNIDGQIACRNLPHIVHRRKIFFLHNYLLFVENMPFDQSNCTQTVELSIQVFVCVDS